MYALKAMGASQSKIRRLRRARATYLLTLRPCMCLTNALATAAGKGDRDDPLQAVPIAFVTQYLQIWFGDGQLRNLIRKAWAGLLVMVTKRQPKARLAQSTGPVYNLITTLLEYGWQMPAADRWTASGT